MKETQTYPTVSVIIRGYNRERYIGRAIESVLAQTYTDFDLLVWDASSLNTPRKTGASVSPHANIGGPSDL